MKHMFTDVDIKDKRQDVHISLIPTVKAQCQSSTSPNHFGAFSMQLDGNLVCTDFNREASYGQGYLMWASQTDHNPGSYLTFEENGVLVIRNVDGTPIWASDTANKGGHHVNLQEDGKFVMYTESGVPIWMIGKC